MIWYLVIGTVPGDLRTSTCRSRRWQTHSAWSAAESFFHDYPNYDRCIVTRIDTSVRGEQQPYVYDRTKTFLRPR